jgi:Type II CAAX prenyl endopeptidase Rce1-like
VTAATVSRTSQLRRAIEITAAVTIWIALGICLHLSVNVYLLLGIPLTAAFQWGVRREPLRALWLRDAQPFRLDTAGWVIAGLLAAYPLFRFIADLRTGPHPAKLGFYLSAVAGALAAAYALRNFHRSTVRPLAMCLVIAGGIGIALMVGGALVGGAAHRTLAQRLSIGLSSLLLYVPISFVLEEVSFRGAFDSHLHHPGESKGLATALFVSALWGLWHLPVALGHAPLPLLILQLLVVHCVIGVPFSLFWRRSGNLFVTGSTHALIDPVRNALLVIPWR